MKKNLLKFIFSSWLILFMFPLFAAENPIALEHFSPNIYDKESITRGAKFFANTCMVCHTLIYLRYDKLAKDAGVVYDKMPINVTQWPLNIRPPDLSLEVQVRGASWIYTYLHSFYTDTTRPLGVNNLLVPNTAMAGIVVPFQGQQIRVQRAAADEHFFGQDYQWYDVLKLQSRGTMSSQEFDNTIGDVVNFLTYAADPHQVERENLGYWVIGFLIILFVLTFLLKKNYWQDVKRTRDE